MFYLYSLRQNNKKKTKKKEKLFSWALPTLLLKLKKNVKLHINQNIIFFSY